MSDAKAPSKARQFWRKEIRPLLILAVVLFSLRSSLADWNDVPTGSMRPTIIEGDRVFVNKLAYDLKVPFTTKHIAEWSNPKRGDVVVFYSPYDEKRLVKRVIGLPGDTIELRDNKLILNGAELSYDPIPEIDNPDVPPIERETHRFAMEQLPNGKHVVASIPAVRAARNFGPYTVPEANFFMMGDNRDNSFDSRFYGPVARKRILGKATAVAISLDHQNYWLPRWHRFFTSLGLTEPQAEAH